MARPAPGNASPTDQARITAYRVLADADAGARVNEALHHALAGDAASRTRQRLTFVGNAVAAVETVRARSASDIACVSHSVVVAVRFACVENAVAVAVRAVSAIDIAFVSHSVAVAVRSAFIRHAVAVAIAGPLGDIIDVRDPVPVAIAACPADDQGKVGVERARLDMAVLDDFVRAHPDGPATGFGVLDEHVFHRVNRIR